MANLVFADPGGDSVEAIGYFCKVNNNSSGISFVTSIKFQGIGSYKFDSGASNLATDVYNPLELLVAAGTRKTVQWRYETVPASATTIVSIVDTLGNQGAIFRVRVKPSGSGVVLQLQNALGTTTDGTTVFNTGSFNRISYSFVLHAVDNLDVKLYLNGIQEVSLTAQPTGGRSVVTGYFYGWDEAPGANRVCYFDQILIDDGNDLSDIGDNKRSTAKLPATANANNFDTTGGTGAVNERPLSETNYKQQAGSSQVSQNYNLETAAGGDIDISSSTIVGYIGWLWAKQAAVSGTPKITVEGTDYAITLTTSPALYIKAITSASYPSNAAAIGMVSSGTADNTFLYECGVVVIYTSTVPVVSIFAADDINADSPGYVHSGIA